MNNPINRPVIPESHDEQRLVEDLNDVYRLPVPAMRFEASRLQPSGNVQVARRSWRPAFAGVAAAALVLSVAGSSVFNGGPREVSAQEVFEKTHALAAMSSATDSVSYRMVAKNESFGASGFQLVTSNTTTQTWYQDPQHQRYETYDEDGNLVFGNSQSGDDLWFYSNVPGEDRLRVVHSTNDQTGFMTFGARDFGAKDLAGLLEMYSGSCANAEKVGEETVAGRPTYVIEVTQTPETCDIKPVITTDGNFTSVKVEAPEGAAGAPAVSVGSVHVRAIDGTPGEPLEGATVPDFEFRVIETTTRMWVDQETFITLKTETEAEDGLLFRYEVTEFEVDPDFDPATFAYEPPAGSEVIEADGPEGIKFFLLGGGGVVSSGTFEVVPSLDSVEVEGSGR